MPNFHFYHNYIHLRHSFLIIYIHIFLFWFPNIHCMNSEEKNSIKHSNNYTNTSINTSLSSHQNRNDRRCIIVFRMPATEITSHLPATAKHKVLRWAWGCCQSNEALMGLDDSNTDKKPRKSSLWPEPMSLPVFRALEESVRLGKLPLRGESSSWEDDLELGACVFSTRRWTYGVYQWGVMTWKIDSPKGK